VATIVMFVDGVLRSHTGSPIYQGLGLYRLLNENNRVILLCSDKPKDDIWLKSNKINKLDDLIGMEIPALGEFPEWRQVEYCRSMGPIEMVFTSDPELANRLLHAGITTVVFLQPAYIKEEFRPDSRVGKKSWTAIVEEVTAQQDNHREDHRLSSN